jgi:hypothetical protein
MLVRCAVALAVTVSAYGLLRVHSQEPSRIQTASDALRGLRSQDERDFFDSCETIANVYSASVEALLKVVNDRQQDQHSTRVRKALVALTRLSCEQAIPACIKQVDYEHRTNIAFEHDPILEDRPFARALADFGKPGIDTILDYLAVGDSDGESPQRLALFAYVIQAAYETVPARNRTAYEYAIRYRGDSRRKSLDVVIKHLQEGPEKTRRSIK